VQNVFCTLHFLLAYLFAERLMLHLQLKIMLMHDDTKSTFSSHLSEKI